jgi:predicted  nucleic acid-binding Zn-ribbon protein
LGFFREGWKELGRKWERNKLRGQLTRLERERTAALARLGQRAWQEKVDLSGFPELSSQLAQLEMRAGVLSAASKSLDAERAGLEEKHRAEAARFDAERRAVEEKKRPVDEALRAARQRQSDQERAVQRLEGRLAALPKELTALEQQVVALSAGAAPDRDAKLAAAAAKRQELEAEKTRLGSEVPAARGALPGLLTEVNRLDAEGQRYAAELTRIENERRAALAALDAELKRVRGQLSDTTRESGAVETQRSERFAELGLGLYGRKVAHPALAEGHQVIAGIDESRAGTQAALQASLGQTQAMPARTMLKFAAVLVLVPALLAGLGYGAWWGWGWWQGRERVVLEPVNPYLVHPLSEHPAYVAANRLVESQTKEEAANHLLTAFRAIGLGVYTGDGTQILGGAERSEKDFFLYDFQWRILARGVHHRNMISLADYSRGLGVGLVELDDPEQMTPFLAQAVGRRYQAAVQNPNDPTSFLILFVDGLARRQLRPYSLDEITSRPAEELDLDPAQAFLLLIDFFLRPPAAEPAPAARGWRPRLTSVHAASPCDLIQGDGQGTWGRGTDVATELAGELPGMAGKIGGVIGSATGVVGFAGDLLTLYGIDVRVEAQPTYVHLRNRDMPDFLAQILVMVTFDGEIVSDQVLKCGWLVGKKMPVKGPMPDVEVYWDFEPYLGPDFEAATDLMYMPRYRQQEAVCPILHVTGGFRTKTDQTGMACFLFRPIRDCRDHPRGKIIAGRQYMAIASTRVVSADMPTPGFLGVGLILKLTPGALEYLTRGRKGYARFWAEWHEKPKDRQY